MAGAGRWVAALLVVAALSTAASAAADPDPMSYSPNWSGYVATNPAGSDPISYSSVTGTWTVPPATCNSKLTTSGSSTVWIGLGGYTTKYDEELGTDSDCNAQNQPIYYAWFELVPNISFKVFPTKTDKVSPGDTITGLVKSLSIRFVLLQIHDQTAGWTFSRTIDYGQQDITSAEWIVEAPTQCENTFNCSQANLTNFGSVTMRDVSATTTKGETGTLTDSNWRVIPIQLVPGPVLVPNLQESPEASSPADKQTAPSPAGASPGPPSGDGSAFTITWLPVSTKGN